MVSEVRIKFIDPDYRRNPKTSLWCCRCQMDIKGPYRVVRLVNGGTHVAHPDDDFADFPEDLGIVPIGLDCARRIGMEWSRNPPE